MMPAANHLRCPPENHHRLHLNSGCILWHHDVRATMATAACSELENVALTALCSSPVPPQMRVSQVPPYKKMALITSATPNKNARVMSKEKRKWDPIEPTISATACAKPRRILSACLIVTATWRKEEGSTYVW